MEEKTRRIAEANLRSIEARELNRGNSYARSGCMNEYILSGFDVANQDERLKGFPCTNSAGARNSLWSTNLGLTCDESLWNACGLHPRQLRRLWKDVRFEYGNELCISALDLALAGARLRLILSLAPTYPGCEAQDLVTNRPLCRCIGAESGNTSREFHAEDLRRARRSGVETLAL